MGRNHSYRIARTLAIPDRSTQKPLDRYEAIRLYLAGELSAEQAEDLKRLHPEWWTLSTSSSAIPAARL